MPIAPIPYNGGQSRLEYYAINGQDITHAPKTGAGLGRDDLLKSSQLRYSTSFKNPELHNNDQTLQYDITHTNALGDQKTPFRGKGTNQTYNDTDAKLGYIARNNYAGGDDFDINGSNALEHAGYSKAGASIGRKLSLDLNKTTWGYKPDETGAGADTNWYTKMIPATIMSDNIGNFIL